MKNLELTGIANTERNIWIRRAAGAGVMSLSLLLTGCGEADQDGTVMKGADGQSYTVPDGAQRPVYASREDCIADVTDQINQIKSAQDDDGNNLDLKVDESPDALCEDASGFVGEDGHPMYNSGSHVGPIIIAGNHWDSGRVRSWTPVKNGGFAAPGRPLQMGIEKAPAGAEIGSKSVIRGGFGSTAKGGFAHGSAS